MKKDNNKVRIIALGGQAEMGRSLYCIEIHNNIFIVDAGFKFPESEKLGVDMVISDFSYLKGREGNVKGIFITHGHDDVMAALPYLLEVVNVPIYGTSTTCELIDAMMKAYNQSFSKSIYYRLQRVKKNGSLNIGGVEIEFFPVTHSLPGAIGIAFRSDEGYIVYSSEFIIDFSANGDFQGDFSKLFEIAKRGVLLLMCESSYSNREGFTSPAHQIVPYIERAFEESEGRIIISTYAQNIYRIQGIIHLIKKYGRKVVFYGKDPHDTVNTILKAEKNSNLNSLGLDSNIIGKKENIGTGEDSDYVIVLSGRPKNIYHDICDIIDGGDERLKLEPSDTFIVASPVLPGTEMIATRAQNELYRTDSKIVLLRNQDLCSMHASVEDIRVMLNTLKPKYYLPIKGEYMHFIYNAEIAKEMGYDDDSIIIMDNGERICFEDGNLQQYRDTFNLDDTLIDGMNNGTTGISDKVIDERLHLQKDGVVIIGVTVNNERKIIANIDVQTRGFIYLRDNEYIIKEINELASTAVEEMKNESGVNIRMNIKDRVSRYIYKETGKRPVILPVLIEI